MTEQTNKQKTYSKTNTSPFAILANGGQLVEYVVPDTLGSRTVVAGGYEAAATAPATRVDDVEGERVGQLGR